MSRRPTEPFTPPWQAWLWPALLGAAALLPAALLALVFTPGWLAAAEAAAAAQRAELRAAARAQPAVAKRVATTPQWPSTADRDDRVARLVALAQGHGLQVLRVQQSWPTSAATPAWHTLGLPLRGTYIDLRSYVEAALLADPALALDGLLLRRGAAAGDAGLLEAELSWALAQTPQLNRNADSRR
jgi:hypothetical protein